MEFFPTIKKIKYGGSSSSDPLTFRYYNPEEIIHGKTMQEWLRFSVCYWHTFRGNGQDSFGAPTLPRPWDNGTDSLENALTRVRVAFEVFEKLGVKYYTFHDRDISPEGKNLEETNSNLDKVSDLLLEMQNKTGIKLLWGTANLFTNARFMNGASTNPDAEVFAYAAAQTKKAMEITHKLNGAGYVFWGGREGLMSYLNTDVRRELDHMSIFLKMAVKHKKHIGFSGQLLIEPKPREPCKHQYDYDAQTCIGFLYRYGLEKDFKLNIEPNHTTLAGHEYEHDILIASKFNMLGSVDSNTGDTLVGWDTDQFPMNVRQTTLTMKIILEQGGIYPGGLNFDCKVRRESTDPEDIFIAHIGAMDCFARGLRCAANILSDNRIPRMVKERYASYDSGIGKKIENGDTDFCMLSEYVLSKYDDDEPKVISGQQEKYEAILNFYV